jgi:thiol-disulfide isomerase/thioredoxin
VKLFAALAFGAIALLAAPDLRRQLQAMDEDVFSRALAANKGKVVLFDFWATWCDTCRAELPALVKLERKWRARGLVLVTVSADEPEQEAAALQFLLKTGVRFPAYVKHVKNDELFIDSIDEKWTGALSGLFLYDRAGQKAASFIGETDNAEIEKALDRLL